MMQTRLWHLLRFVSLMVIAGASSREAHAQVVDIAASSIIDSAASARSAYGDATRANTVPATLAFLLQAARAWPTQPAYWSAAAHFAARASDTVAAVEAISALRGMQTGRALLADTTMLRMAQTPAIRTALDALDRATRNVPAGHVVATLTDSTVFAEGMDADVRTGALYVASIRHGTVYEVRADGTIRDLGLARHERVGAVLGVRVAPDGQTLFATTAGLPTNTRFTVADSALSAVLQIRVRDGAIVRRWDMLPDGAAHLLGDVAVANDGTVYASDSYAPLLLRIRPGSSTFDTITHPLFRSLQGIAIVPQTQTVIVADYSHGLLRVNVTDNTVYRIRDVPGTTSLGMDGITWYHGAIIGVQNGVSPARIMRFQLNEAMTRIQSATIVDMQPELAEEPTIGTLLGDGFVYVANSQWEKYDDAGARRPNTQLQPTRIMCVALITDDTTSRGMTQSEPNSGRNGTRSTASAPPPSRSCSVREARPE